MKKICFLIATTALLPLHLHAQAVPLPQLLNFDGQLINSTNNTPITTAVPVTFEIWDGSGAPYCLLYQETQSVTPNADGEFSVKIGPDTGNPSPSDDGDLLWPAIFKNNGQVRPHNTTFCNSGYTPAAGHGRRLRVIVNTVTLTPDYTIAPVPMATVAETLQGKSPNDFLLASPPAADANTSVLTGNLRLNNNYGLQLTNSTSTNFVTLRSPSGLAADYTLLLPTNDGNSGDILSTDGSGVLSWIAPSGGGAVTSVFGRTGTVVSVGGDYNAGQITSTAVGNIAAVDVQSAIAELEGDKISTGTGVISSSMIAASAVTSSLIANGTITSADISDVSISQITNGAGLYFGYRPNNTACATGEVLKWDNTTSRWICGSEFALPSQGGNAGRFLTTDGTTASWATNLFDDGSGNIGLGTMTPSSTFHIVDTVAIQNIESTSGGNPGLLLLSGTTGTPFMSVGDVIFKNTAGGGTLLAAVKGITDSTSTNGALVFSSGNSGALSERVRINSAGQVGIGVNTPTTMLDVNGVVTVRPQGTAAGEGGRIILRELAANSIESVGLRAPDSIVSNVMLTLPPTAGSAGQLLQTDGTGVLSWANPPSLTSGVCSFTLPTYAADTEITPQTCSGVPPMTNVAVHCSPSTPVAGYITARATGAANQIAITVGVAGTSTPLTCMWMVP